MSCLRNLYLPQGHWVKNLKKNRCVFSASFFFISLLETNDNKLLGGWRNHKMKGDWDLITAQSRVTSQDHLAGHTRWKGMSVVLASLTSWVCLLW